MQPRALPSPQLTVCIPIDMHGVFVWKPASAVGSGRGECGVPFPPAVEPGPTKLVWVEGLEPKALGGERKHLKGF